MLASIIYYSWGRWEVARSYITEHIAIQGLQDATFQFLNKRTLCIPVSTRILCVLHVTEFLLQKD